MTGFSVAGSANSLAELGVDAVALPDGRSYLLRGGHRLWAAPEIPEITYEPDDHPVAVTQTDQQITVIQPASEAIGISKSLEITLHGGHVAIVHTLTNEGSAPREIAPWAITQLPVGGTAIIPLRNEPADPHQLQPNASIVLWPYAGVADSPFVIESRLLILDSKRTVATKVGTPLDRGWLAYVRNGLVFVKRAAHKAGGRYLDLEASAQCYSSPDFIELETLGPQAVLAPGTMTTHVETWELHIVDPDIAPSQIPDLLDLDGGSSP